MKFIFLFLIVSLSIQFQDEQLNRMLELVKGKRIGIITNPTGIDLNLKMMVDMIVDECITYNCEVKAFFSPEHGMRGDKQDGVQIDDYVDQLTNVTVYSLYGHRKAPTDEQLKDIDAVIFYIQDVGTRFYTFIWTMSYCMEALIGKKIEFIIIDRPNPIFGDIVSGCPNNQDYGLIGRLLPGQKFGLPQRYGMTIGELGLMINSWLGGQVNLKIVTMKNYSRSKSLVENNKTWISPSPNMPSELTALVYPGFGIFEGSNISEGRGTTHPFEIIGAPFIKNPEILADQLNKLNLSGVLFRGLYFTPTFSKYQGEICGGIQIHVNNRRLFDPILSGLYVLKYIINLYPNQVIVNDQANKEFGLNDFNKLIFSLEPEEILKSCTQDIIEFYQERNNYLIY